jgi:imidazole glycerol-phosphate synthase subunit HisH
VIAVVDSGVANLTSVMAALGRLGVEAAVTADAGCIGKADRVIVPGVGAAAAAMAQLKNKNLCDVLCALTKPVLGICLGMQILFARSFEGKGEPIQCLGVFPDDVRVIKATPQTPVPHMGWNQITPLKADHPLLRGIEKNSYVYFVHSYAAPVSDTTLATTDYGGNFAAMAGARNFFGCQFHPERSGAVGSRILENFVRI